MRAGDLRNRVKIQSKSVTRNTFGEEVVSWVDVATVWAAIEPLSGREFLAAQAVNAELTVRIRIRYRTGIDSSMRVLFGTRVFEIISPPINPVSDKRELHLMCKELT